MHPERQFSLRRVRRLGRVSIVTREQDGVVTPQWLITARKRRKKFILALTAVFLILTLLSFVALPMLEKAAIKAAVEDGVRLKKHVGLLADLAGTFQVLWVGIAIGCVVVILLVLTGKLDPMLRLSTAILILGGAGAVVFTGYVFYLPLVSMVQKATG